MPDISLSQQIQLEEFKILRGEIELRGASHRTTERGVILADAAVYGALLFQAHETVSGSIITIMWFVPPMIGLLALFRWWESFSIIELLARYIRDIETQYLRNGVRGWETYLACDVRRGKKVGALWLVYILFWWCLIGLPLGVGLQQASMINKWALGFWSIAAGPIVSLVLIAGIFAYLRVTPVPDPSKRAAADQLDA